MGQGVVDLAGEPGPFLQDPLRPFGGGKIGPCGGELVDQLRLPHVALLGHLDLEPDQDADHEDANRNYDGPERRTEVEPRPGPQRRDEAGRRKPELLECGETDGVDHKGQDRPVVVLEEQHRPTGDGHDAERRDHPTVPVGKRGGKYHQDEYTHQGGQSGHHHVPDPIEGRPVGNGAR